MKLGIFACAVSATMTACLSSSMGVGRTAMESTQLESRPQVKLPANVEEVIWWLPSDSQTLIVRQTPRTVGAFRSKGNDSLRAAEESQITELGILGSLCDGELLALLAGLKVVLQVEGSRKFRAPIGLGPTRFEGVQIFRFQDRLGDIGTRLKDSLTKRASRTEVIGGQSVAVFDQRVERTSWTFYVSIPEPDLLVCATDRATVVDVYRRKTVRAHKRALPPELPEWRFLDPAAGLWAIRHFDPEDSFDDPTSPLANATHGGVNVPDKQAVGLLCYYAPEKKRVAHLIYFSSNSNSMNLAQSFWSQVPRGKEPLVRRLATDAVEMQFSFEAVDRQIETDFLSKLSSALGHTVFL
jgi:hypothetical protein